MSINERIKLLVDTQANGNQAAFAKKTNIKPSALASYMPNSVKISKPSGEVLSNILNSYPLISAEWLMRGKGDMIKSGTSVPYLASSNYRMYINKLEKHGFYADLPYIDSPYTEDPDLITRAIELNNQNLKGLHAGSVGFCVSVGWTSTMLEVGQPYVIVSKDGITNARFFKENNQQLIFDNDFNQNTFHYNSEEILELWKITYAIIYEFPRPFDEIKNDVGTIEEKDIFKESITHTIKNLSKEEIRNFINERIRLLEHEAEKETIKLNYLRDEQKNLHILLFAFGT